jgi:hypothetical protein
MANIPVNATAIPLIQGQSITGSFAGFIVCPNTSTSPQATVAHFKGLKDSTNRELAISKEISNYKNEPKKDYCRTNKSSKPKPINIELKKVE